MKDVDVACRSYLRLHLAEGVGPLTFRALLDAFGDAQSVFAAGPAKASSVRGVGEKVTRAIFAVNDADVDAELAAAENRGVRIISLASADYPVALKNTHDPPPVLYVRGRLEANDTIALGMVGSRRCTHYGMEQAGRFGALLGRAGFTVVSGGARGIDTAAHRGALDSGGRTIAVMGCGLNHVYPRENCELFDRIVDEDCGAVVSELPMATDVRSRNFPRRNRIISGLSQGVLIVEAAYKSGSLITARLADEQGRAVFALPGRVDSPFSQGTNQLIRDGAVLVRNLEDILEQLGGLGETLERVTPGSILAEAPPAREVSLDETEKKIVAAFDTEPMSIDQISAATDLPAHRVVAAMTTLTLKGVVASQPGNVFILKRGTEAGG
jgi:DNA processing protein